MERDYIDIYCERVGPEFWAEPVNALTNLAFLVSAALLTLMLVRRGADGGRDPAAWTLVGLVYLIGIGSGLFHTLAVRWALLADVIPIALFILIYTYYALRRFVGLAVWGGLIGVVAVLAVAAATPPLTGFRGGSYVAALLAMIVIGSVLRLRGGHPAGGAILSAAGVFAVSLAFRTADGPLCEAFPTGTHFVWHMLNAVVLYIVARAMIRFGRADA